MRWRGPAVTANEGLILLSEMMLHNDYDRRCSVEKNICRESQRAWHQDEQSGGTLSLSQRVTCETVASL
jgi:hypothetical protein